MAGDSTSPSFRKEFATTSSALKIVQRTGGHSRKAPSMPMVRRVRTLGLQRAHICLQARSYSSINSRVGVVLCMHCIASTEPATLL